MTVKSCLQRCQVLLDTTLKISLLAPGTENARPERQVPNLNYKNTTEIIVQAIADSRSTLHNLLVKLNTNVSILTF